MKFLRCWRRLHFGFSFYVPTTMTLSITTVVFWLPSGLTPALYTTAHLSTKPPHYYTTTHITNKSVRLLHCFFPFNILLSCCFRAIDGYIFIDL